MNTKYGELEVQELINMVTILDPRFRSQYESRRDPGHQRVLRDVESFSVMPSAAGSATPVTTP